VGAASRSGPSHRNGFMYSTNKKIHEPNSPSRKPHLMALLGGTFTSTVERVQLKIQNKSRVNDHLYKTFAIRLTKTAWATNLSSNHRPWQRSTVDPLRSRKGLANQSPHKTQPRRAQHPASNEFLWNFCYPVRLTSLCSGMKLIRYWTKIINLLTVVL